MNNKKIDINSDGIGFCDLLTVAFIVLKLCGIISWNWFWVISPLIFHWILVIILIIITAIYEAKNNIKQTEGENYGNYYSKRYERNCQKVW